MSVMVVQPVSPKDVKRYRAKAVLKFSRVLPITLKPLRDDSIKIPEWSRKVKGYFSARIGFLIEFWVGRDKRRVYSAEVSEACLLNTVYKHIANVLDLEPDNMLLKLYTREKCIFIIPFKIAQTNPNLSFGKLLTQYGPDVVLVITIQPEVDKLFTETFVVDIPDYQSEFNRVHDQVISSTSQKNPNSPIGTRKQS